MSYISNDLTRYTCENSHFEPCRNYISLSKIASPVEELIADYGNGFEDSVPIRLKCYKGYQMEADLKSRLFHLFPDKVQDGGEISIEGGLIKGHPDFLWNGMPGDCKSVLKDEWMPVDQLPRRIYWQIQAYMLYSHKEKGLLIFESRETGLIKDFWVYANQRVMADIKDKVNQIVSILKHDPAKVKTL